MPDALNRKIQVILLMLTKLAVFSATDIFLTSLPSMAGYFGTSDDFIQLSIPFYLLGSLFAAPFIGTLSDRFGRKPLLLGGLCLFLLGTLGCLLAPNAPLFIFARFIQGLGAVAPSVVGWVMIQDLYPGDEGSKIMSWVGAIVSVGPFVAPSLGGYIHKLYGWQGSFIGLLVFTLPVTFGWTIIKITGPYKHPDQRLTLGKTLSTYKIIVKNKIFLGYVLMFSLLGAGETCYLTVSPFYFEKVLHLSPEIFGLYLSASASFYIFGTLCTNSIMKKFGVEGALKIGALISVCGALILGGTALFVPHTINAVALSFCVYLFGAAIVWGPSTSRAIQQFESSKGAASAVRSLILTGAFSLGGFIGSLLNDTSLVPLSGVILAIATVCLIVVKRVVKESIIRR